MVRLEARNDLFGVVPNGPLSGQAPQTAKTDKTSVQTAVSRWLQRTAAHNSGNTASRLSAVLLIGNSSSGLKPIKPNTPVAKTAAAGNPHFVLNDVLL